MDTLIPYDAKLLAEHARRGEPLFAKYAREAKSWGKFAQRPTAKRVLAADAATLVSVLVLATAKATVTKHSKTEWNACWELSQELPRHVKEATPADAVLLLAFGSQSGLTRYGEPLIKPGLMVAEKALRKSPNDASIRAAARKLVAKIDKYTKRKVAAKLRALAAIEKTPTVTRAAKTPAAKTSELPKAFAKVTRAKLPKWWHPAELSRPITKGGAALDDDAMGMLASALMTDATSAIAAAREAFDTRSLAVFAWDLYAAWIDAGSDMKHKWALGALGHFGDDETATKLASLLPEWAVDYSTRAGVAVVALARMAEHGSDAALGALQSASMTGRTSMLKHRAKVALAELAKIRGIDPEELAVPRFGLGPDGTREMTLGGKKYRAGFDATLRPILRDAAGKIVSKPPKPKAGDADEWTTFVRGVRKIASAQVLRLERAMRDGLVWQARVFEASFARHPLMTHAARGLVWSVDGAKRTFRIAEDGSYADENDRAFKLPAKASVRVAHPVELSAETLGRWRAVFESYKLIQPFQQLGRGTYTLEPAERKAKTLARFQGIEATVGRVLALERCGWERDAADDGESITWMCRTLRPDFVAVIELDPGLSVRMLSVHPKQTVTGVMLAGKKGMRAKLGALTLVEASELMLDVESLR